MKKTFIILLVIVACLLFVCCKQEPDFTDVYDPSAPEQDQPNTSQPDNNDTPNNNISVTPDINTAVNEQNAHKIFLNDVNNNVNGSNVLFTDDSVIYIAFVEDPGDEYMGGGYGIFRANKDFTNVQQIRQPSFPLRNMLVYDNVLYYTSGDGGARRIFTLDLETLENNTFYNDEQRSTYVDFMQYYDGKIYFENDSYIARMNPDKSEFETLLTIEGEFSLSALAVFEDNIFYVNHNDNTLCRLDINTLENTVFMENYVPSPISFYNSRVYYTDGARLVSSDIEGVEKRTVIELEENEAFSTLNVADGYIYYSYSSEQNPFNRNDEYYLCRYNLNGGDNKLIHSGDHYSQLSINNGKIYAVLNDSDLYTTELYEIDPETLQIRVIE